MADHSGVSSLCARPAHPRLFATLVGGCAAALLSAGWSEPALSQTLDPTTLTKYVDALPNPLADNLATPTAQIDGEDWYDVHVTQFNAAVHSELPPTTFWGYDQSLPGPTFVVQSGQTIHVRWHNDLRDAQGFPLPNLLPYDPTIHGTMSGGHMGGAMGAGAGDMDGHAEGTMSGTVLPQARIVTHLHGGVVHEASDGFPFHWITSNPNAMANGMGGPAGNIYTTHYTNDQRSNALWYHDHTMGITRLNVYAGMAGMYFIRDAEEAAANLPQGKYEVPLMLMDRSFNADGSLYYPDGLDLVPASFKTDNPEATGSVIHAFYGHANLVNGKVWPYHDVEQRLYRFRIYNAANARDYVLVFEDELGNPLTVHQIGTDGGLLESPAARTSIEMGPADRVDVLVDFSQIPAGKPVYLKNYGPAGMSPTGPLADPNTVGQVMKFNVTGPAADTSNNAVPAHLSTIDRYIDPIDASTVVTDLPLTISRVLDQYNRQKLLLGGRNWDDPVVEQVNLGQVQVWEFINQTNNNHPMHLHLEAFQVLDRKDQFGADIPLQPWETGFEDTFNVGPRQRVRIAVRCSQYTGEFVYHCHVIEHEDYEMMRPFRVNNTLPGDTDHDGDIDDFDIINAIVNYTGSLPYGTGGKSALEGDTDNDADVDDFDIITLIVGYTGSLSTPAE